MRKTLSLFFAFSRSSRATLSLTIEIIIGIILVVGSLSVFFSIAEDILTNDTIRFDAMLVSFIYSFRNPTLTVIMQGITLLGNQGILALGVSVLIMLLFWNKYKRDAFIFSFILLFGAGLNILLKDFFHRPRPTYLPLVHETTYSFPSGHAMNSFIFYTSLSYFIFWRLKNNTLKIVSITLSFIVILFVGISRIYLGAHYPSDVLAGFAAGLIWFGIVVLFEKTTEVLHLFKQYEKEKKF